MENKKICDNLLQEINFEKYKIKKYGIYDTLLYVILGFVFLINTYKNSIVLIIITTFITCIAFKIAYKQRKIRIKELDYSLKILIENFGEISKELDIKLVNSEKEYTSTQNYFIDFSRKIVFKFSQIESINLKISRSFLYLTDNYKVCQFVWLKASENTEIRVINWSSKRNFGEVGDVYDLIEKKVIKQ